MVKLFRKFHAHFQNSHLQCALVKVASICCSIKCEIRHWVDFVWHVFTCHTICLCMWWAAYNQVSWYQVRPASTNFARILRRQSRNWCQTLPPLCLLMPRIRSLPARVTPTLSQFWQEQGRDLSGAQIIRMVGKFLPGQTPLCHVTATSPQVMCHVSSFVSLDSSCMPELSWILVNNIVSERTVHFSVDRFLWCT